MNVATDHAARQRLSRQPYQRIGVMPPGRLVRFRNRDVRALVLGPDADPAYVRLRIYRGPRFGFGPTTRCPTGTRIRVWTPAASARPA